MSRVVSCSFFFLFLTQGLRSTGRVYLFLVIVLVLVLVLPASLTIVLALVHVICVRSRRKVTFG